MSTTLPHGIIQINEGNIAWYGDITANWQLIDSKIGVYDAAIATIPAPANSGTLTINYGGTTIAMYGPKPVILSLSGLISHHPTLFL